jgi:hypothetical protein
MHAIVPAGFLGLPSLHSIIEGIAKGFFGALAHALVPSWLTHGTVATIQHLVALPDPAKWTHVGQLQGEMVFLAAMLLPVTLAVSTLRYWLIGLTGAAHPVGALGRSVWVTFLLVSYRWIVEQTVAAANTLTHAILGFPVVAAGLQRIIGVLFGGALLSGAGGVFGAFLVIAGVLFAAGLFAAQVLLTVVLAVLVVAGPPLIVLSAIPELSHLARSWAHALIAVTLVPFGWTVLFATAGALCLDATSFTGGAGGLPGHVAAAFAGLITFALAVKLPLMLLSELRRLFGAAGAGSSSAGAGQGTMPGAQRMSAARARLRGVPDGVVSLGRSAGRAAGALGAPQGGPLGAARRGLAGATNRTGTRATPAGAAAAAVAGVAGGGAAGVVASRGGGGVRERLRNAGAVLLGAPREARAAMTASVSRKASGTSGHGGRRASGRTTSTRATPGKRASVPAQSNGAAVNRATPTPTATARPKPPGSTPAASPAGTPSTKPSSGSGAGHPGRQVSSDAARNAAGESATPKAPRPVKAARVSKGPARPGRRGAGRRRRKPRPGGGS